MLSAILAVVDSFITLQPGVRPRQANALFPSHFQSEASLNLISDSCADSSLISPKSALVLQERGSSL